jgi:predicted ArsR family transcriptional regulator
MKSKLIRKFAQGQKYRILCALKRDGALSVPDLLKSIQLSYMGIKQHCIELERDGYLVKKRKPKLSGRGRPEQMYEITAAAEDFFPRHDTPLTLQIMSALRTLYGTNAPEKILFTLYQDLAQQYRKRMSSMLLEDRVRDFVHLREQDGYLLELVPGTNGTAWEVTECHSPISGLIGEFPILLKFELQVYQKILHPKVLQEKVSSSPYRVGYQIPKS